jgi:hypothetical protein
MIEIPGWNLHFKNVFLPGIFHATDVFMQQFKMFFEAFSRHQVLRSLD